MAPALYNPPDAVLGDSMINGGDTTPMTRDLQVIYSSWNLPLPAVELGGAPETTCSWDETDAICLYPSGLHFRLDEALEGG